MRKLWARISIELKVSDEQLADIIKESQETLPDGTSVFSDYLVPDELALRFVKEGSLSEDSYIPSVVLEELSSAVPEKL